MFTVAVPCTVADDNRLEQLESLESLDLVILITLDQIQVYFRILVVLVFYLRSSYFYGQQYML